jgi:hypothetical protein
LQTQFVFKYSAGANGGPFVVTLNHGKFQNPRTTPSGKKYATKKERKEKNPKNTGH